MMESGTGRLVSVMVGIFMTALALSAGAADGRIPIGTAPAFISAPGDYYLTADLSASGTVINISAGNVTLDLNGHILTNTGNYSTILANSVTNLNIFGGSLVGGWYGVSVVNATAGVISLHHLRITGATTAGISIQGASQYPAIRLTDNDISCYLAAGSAGQGIQLTQVWSGRISSNSLMGQSPGGSGTGINLNVASGLLIEDNSISYFGTGIYVAQGSGTKLLRNNVFSNTTGIYVSTGIGIEAQENLISSNSGTGLLFSYSSLACAYRGNTSQNNGTNYSIPAGGVTNAGGNY
jgi:parallel beta-helix repeat protein